MPRRAAIWVQVRPWDLARATAAARSRLAWLAAARGSAAQAGAAGSRAGGRRRGNEALAEGGAAPGARAAQREGAEPDLGGQGAVRAQDRVTGVVAADRRRGVRPALTPWRRRGVLVRGGAGRRDPPPP